MGPHDRVPQEDAFLSSLLRQVPDAVIPAKAGIQLPSSALNGKASSPRLDADRLDSSAATYIVNTLIRRSFIAGMAALPLIGRFSAKAEGEADLLELPVPDMDRLQSNVWIRKLAPGVWITCFTARRPGIGYYPANGLIVAGDDGVTIVDTGYDADQGTVLLAAANKMTGKAAVRAIATHFHSDRTGGVEATRKAGVPIFAHPYSVGLAQAYGDPAPDPVKGLEKDPVQLGPVELFFPGPGHTRDNITVWHAPTQTLFGGCLLKSVTTPNLGNLADADMASYPGTLQRLAQRYPERRFTVPGHGSINGDALAWTLKMADTHRP